LKTLTFNKNYKKNYQARCYIHSNKKLDPLSKMGLKNFRHWIW